MDTVTRKLSNDNVRFRAPLQPVSYAQGAATTAINSNSWCKRVGLRVHNCYWRNWVQLHNTKYSNIWFQLYWFLTLMVVKVQEEIVVQSGFCNTFKF
jgi:hypothetical protein